MNKNKIYDLLKLADKKLKESDMYNDGKIAETYDGKTAALSVSVAMSDLLPTLAIYFQDYDDNDKSAPCRRNVLNVVATMITIPDKNESFSDAQALLEYAIEHKDKLNYLKNEVIDCSIALKQVVRTYNLI